jgi:hypothetical protein
VTYVHRNGLANFDDFAGVRQLNENCLGLSFRRSTPGPYAKVQARIADRGFRRFFVFPDYVRHARFRTAKRQVDRANQAQRKSDGDAHHYDDSL